MKTKKPTTKKKKNSDLASLVKKSKKKRSTKVEMVKVEELPLTKQKLGLTERRNAALKLFLKGFGPWEVKDKLGISYDTAKSYWAYHQEKIERQAENNPHLLKNLVAHTIRSMEELNVLRQEAWALYDKPILIGEDDAGNPLYRDQPAVTKNNILKTITSIHDQQNKILGLFGIKAEYFAQVAQVQRLQTRILEFMQEELCDADREKMMRFLSELQPETVQVPALEGEVVEG